jgi:Arc/MetJ-type ribon-helix-helix transcriptional regulator
MRTITVNLPEEVAEMMDEHVRNGHWSNVDDMIACGLVMASDDADSQPPAKEDLRRSILEAVAQSERGECSDGEEFMQELIASCDARSIGSK